jgi:hypothetical protein
MNDRSTSPLSVQDLTEAVASGVLRALAIHQAAHDAPADAETLSKGGGAFASLTIVCGQWPTGNRNPLGTGIPGPFGGIAGGIAGEQSGG